MKNQLLSSVSEQHKNYQEIENLYQVFSHYGSIESMEYDLYDIEPQEVLSLTTTPLQQLPVESLKRYAYKAITNIGSVENYKYFLPRIAELILEGQLSICDFYTRICDTDANWNSWSIEEKNAIKQFCICLLKHSLKQRAEGADLSLYELYKYISPFISQKQLIDLLASDPQGMIHAAYLIYDMRRDKIEAIDRYPILFNWLVSLRVRLKDMLCVHQLQPSDEAIVITEALQVIGLYSA
ncbi:MAG: hypothetical protein K0S74_1476 [Chlamydiales bacterium]|jgi:hypothetical protein|nr:hypothetical protein [Chlamydiales bacterium]